MEIDRNQIKDIVAKVIEQMDRGPQGRERFASGKSVPLIKPKLASSQLMGIFPSIDEAVRNAQASFQVWIHMPLTRRHETIERIRQKLRDSVRLISDYAVEETGLGRAEDKVNKNLLVINKTPGIEFLKPDAFSGDGGLTITERAPYGVIGSITPCTNPSETIINNGIGMIAGGNAVVFNAHPTAKKVSAITIDLINRVIVDGGGPDSLLSACEDPTIESAGQLMKHPGIALLVVTGGPAVVRAAMASGKKVIAAGPGNPPVVVDETADLDKAGKGIVRGASFDNNIICTDEKEVLVVKSVATKLKERMLANGAFEIPSHKMRALEKLVLVDGHVAKDYVGKNANVILNDIGITPKEDYRLILAEVDFDHPFVQTEMLMPVFPLVRCDSADEAIELAFKAEKGCRHTASIYSRNIDAMDKMARLMNCSIFIKNAPNYAGLGFGGEGYTSFTIASPTGEGMTTVRNFTRERRCALIDYFRIV